MIPLLFLNVRCPLISLQSKKQGTPIFHRLLNRIIIPKISSIKTINSVIGPAVESYLENFSIFSTTNYWIFGRTLEEFKELGVDLCLYSALTLVKSLLTLEHTCTQNCILTWFLKSVFQTLGPNTLAIINCSLFAGILHSILTCHFYQRF